MKPSVCKRGILAGLLCGLLLAGCATAPPRTSPAPGMPQIVPPPAATLGTQIAVRAMSLLGAPYRYGGNGPEAFDCSGLVRFVHLALGIDTPRTTLDQFKAARPVELGAIQAGDVLFFRIQGPRVSHVGIYAGDGRFVHAPQTGRPVETRSVDDPYYRSRILGAGRLH